MAWDTYGTELILVALFVLFLRPAIQALGSMTLNTALLPNFGTLIRWRAHRHVLRQSVGWFENDFAGRIANRIVQTPPAAGEAMFQVFDAMAYALAYIIGATILLSDADPRLAIPLLIWFALYAVLVVWVIKRIGPASQARIGCPQPGHRPGRGQLHQHPRRQDVRAPRPRGRLCQRGHRKDAAHLPGRDAAFHDHGHRLGHAEWLC